MKKFLKNLFLYLSAFVPMYFLVFVKLFFELVNKNLSWNTLNTINFCTLLLLIAGGVWGVIWNVKFSGQKSIKVEIISAKNITDNHFLGYFSLFVFFAIPLDLSLVSTFCVYVLVLVMIGIVYITNSLYYINPLLNILGFSFFDVTYKEDDKNETKNAKIFFRGQNFDKKVCWIKVKNNHFCFIDKKK